MKHVIMAVSITVDNCVGIHQLAEYINEAVTYWGGQLHPDDPLFSSNTKHVAVKHISTYKE